jgi:hypothetical protein
MEIITWPLSKEEIKRFDCLNSVKVPPGYSSNIQRIINYKEKKIHKIEGSCLPHVDDTIVACCTKGYSTKECEIDNRQRMCIPQPDLSEGNPSRQARQL